MYKIHKRIGEFKLKNIIYYLQTTTKKLKGNQNFCKVMLSLLDLSA